jgi:hypothetical protein
MLPLTILFPEFVIVFCIIGAVISMVLLFSNFGEKKDGHEDHPHH